MAVCVGVGEMVTEGKTNVFFSLNDGSSKIFVGVEDN